MGSGASGASDEELDVDVDVDDDIDDEEASAATSGLRGAIDDEAAPSPPSGSLCDDDTEDIGAADAASAFGSGARWGSVAIFRFLTMLHFSGPNWARKIRHCYEKVTELMYMGLC